MCLQAQLTILPLRCISAIFTFILHIGRPSSEVRALSGHQLFDVVCAALLIGAVACLQLLQPGIIYYWMKDITSEFLKIQVLFSALEILDKVREKGGGWVKGGRRGGGGIHSVVSVIACHGLPRGDIKIDA